MQPEYQVYATLFDAFAWYKRSEREDAQQEFLDKVNRVETPKTPAQLRGMAFNDIVDRAAVKWGGFPEEAITVYDTLCPGFIVNEFAAAFKHAARQVYVETCLQTNYGLVKVYGYMDELLADTAYEIKTCKEYVFPKYLHNWQHPVYLECLKAKGLNVPNFRYLATDFEEIYTEDYVYNSADTDRLISQCAQLIEFLEANRARITDRKIFNLPPLEKAA